MEIRKEDGREEPDREQALNGESLHQVEELEEAWAALSCGCGCDSSGE
jgi:hypothetical protein